MRFFFVYKRLREMSENEMIVKKLRENRDMLVIFHKNIKNGLHFE